MKNQKTELKTLKDLEFKKIYTGGKRDDSFCLTSQLKAEAVKWVKIEKPKLYGKPIIEGNYTSEQVRECIKDWIKHFFNLTKEDLK